MTNIWAIATVIAGMTTVVTEALNSKLKPNGVWRQVMSWGVAVVLTIGLYFAGTYEFAGNPWISVPLTGIATGLVANGLYDVPTIKEWVKTFVEFFSSKNTEDKNS